MIGPPDKAIEAAADVLYAKGCPRSYGNRAVEAAYPIIRDAVIAEIVTDLNCAMDDPKCPWQGAAKFLAHKHGLEITKSGRAMTDADFEELADEAERGYDVDHLLRTRNADEN